VKLVQTGVQVPVKAVRISEYHFRKETVQENLDALAESLRAVGQIHNISVVLARDGEYELANGHRRLLAAKMTGLETIRADIYEFTAEEMADEQERQKAISQFLLAANQAEPLIPVERARFYRDVMENFGWDPDRICQFYGVPKADILRDLKYLNISPKVLDIVAAHPDKVGTGQLELLAEYASSDKKGWRISETEQVALAETLVAQTDKVAAEDPKEFERTIRRLKAEERSRRSQENKAKQQRQPVQVVKDVVRALEGVDASCKALARIDVPATTSIEFVDKREMIDRCYELAQTLIGFADRKIGPLPLKKASVEAGSP
jgi:ParB family chromosome partitioning protein